MMRNLSKSLIDNQNHLTSDRRLKTMILHKAATAYFYLMSRSRKEENYGSALRYLRLALNCYGSSSECFSLSNQSLKNTFVFVNFRWSSQVEFLRSELFEYRLEKSVESHNERCW